MLVMKNSKSSDNGGHGITALINRQLQGRYSSSPSLVLTWLALASLVQNVRYLDGFVRVSSLDWLPVYSALIEICRRVLN